MVDAPVAIALAAAAAGVAGCVDAIAGGGGIITLPTLLFMGLPPATAVATNKLVSTCGASAAALTFVRKKCYAPEVTLPAMPFTAVGAVTGAYLVALVHPEFLKPLIGVIICLLAVYFWVRPDLGILAKYRGLNARLTVLLFSGALAIGFYDGFLGPGTGTFLAFLMVRGLGFDFVYAAGNTKILNWTSNIVSLLWFATHGKLALSVGIPMAAANLVGGYIGARLAVSKGSRWVRWIYLLMALAVATKLLLFP